MSSSYYARQPKQNRSQAGMVSIMTTMVLMIVITLIVLGFAQISRRNQRQTLDRQLSTQAFYAAESGINDARHLIETKLAAGVTNIPSKDGCTATGTGNFYSSANGIVPDIDAAKGIKYSCLLVNPTPTKLRYSNVGTGSLVVPITNASGGSVGDLSFSVQAKSGGTPSANCPTGLTNQFKPASGWTCGYGVLRFDLVPIGSGMDLNSLMDSTMTTFAVPIKTATLTSVPYAGGRSNSNDLAAMQCDDNSCNFKVTGLPQNSYYLRISSIYKDVSMQITSQSGAVEFADAQAVIDATGRSGDVLRRIQVNVPLTANSANQLSDYALESTDSVCKRFSVMDGLYSNSISIPSATSRLCR